MTEINYLFIGNNNFFINQEINKKIESFQEEDIDIIKYDLRDCVLKEIIEELRTISIFLDSKKLVVVKNIDEYNKQSIDDQELFDGYLLKPNPDSILIMSSSDNNFLNSKIGSILQKTAVIKVIVEPQINDYNEYIMSVLKDKGYIIEIDAVKEIVDRTSQNFYLINQELEKLMTYCFDEKTISYQAVSLVVSKNSDDKIYELTKKLLDKDIEKALNIHNELISKNEDPQKIINNIATRIGELVEIKLLLDKKYTQDMIADFYGIKTGRAYYLIKDAQKITSKTLEIYLKKVFDLDYKVKSGQIDKKMGLELLILGV